MSHLASIFGPAVSTNEPQCEWFHHVVEVDNRKGSRRRYPSVENISHICCRQSYAKQRMEFCGPLHDITYSNSMTELSDHNSLAPISHT